jgi:ABC-type uncharacterized transport system substrate-binding protein
MGGDGKIGAIGIEWTFDEFFSALMIEGLDKNGDGTYTEEELSKLAMENRESLKEVGYFVKLTVNGQAAQLHDPDRFAYAYENGLLRLRFSLPLGIAADPAKDAISFKGYDPSYYTEIRIAKDSDVTIHGPCRSEISVPKMSVTTLTGVTEQDWEDPNRFEGMGAFFAQDVAIKCG